MASSKYEGYDDGEITCTDVYSIADGSGRDIWTATLSGFCHVYYAVDRDNPVDFILEGMNGNTYVGELKNREKCPPERKAKYDKEGWMDVRRMEGQMSQGEDEGNWGKRCSLRHYNG